ncbi:MAG: T9SS type A sorting domain-containing protein [FCB group bacterium]|jgi:photosystem II stability/assembly factor-like uncharacterized protein
MKTKSTKPALNKHFKDYPFIMKNLLLLILFSFSSFIAINAQWEPCNNGIPYCEAFGFIKDSNNTYAGVDCGVYLTTNNGDNWIPKNNGITGINDLRSLAISENNIFAGSSFNGIFLSTDKGENWVKKSNGLPYNPYTLHTSYIEQINIIIISGNNIFAGTSRGVFLSTDNGENWTAKNNGLPLDTVHMDIYAMVISDNNIFAGTRYGIYISTDNGENWTAKNNGLPLDSMQCYIYSMAISGNNIFAGTWVGGLFLSTDNGDNWKNIGFKDSFVNVLFINGNYIFASGGDGFYLSIDNGNSWTDKNSGNISGLIINGDYIFAASTFDGFYRAKISDLITDVNENNPNNESIIYPNPASSSVSVKYESSSYSKFQISIFDLLGNEVFSSSEECNIGMNEKTIDCRSLGTGYYIIRLKQGERVETKPLLLITN